MAAGRAQVASSFTVIKGALIEETYRAFQDWDLSLSRSDNLTRMKERNTIGASSSNWLRDVAFVLNRRFDPQGRDRALVELAQAGFSREAWRPILLWHMTRDEFLLRDFLCHWLFGQYTEGAYRLRSDDLIPYLEALPKQGVTSTETWSPQTLKRVASGLLRMAVDFGLMRGTMAREFVSYHLPDDAMLYLLHAISEREGNPGAVVQSEDWRMVLMEPDDVERELFRLHQFRKLRYEVAGSLAQLDLPCDTALQYAREVLV